MSRFGDGDVVRLPIAGKSTLDPNAKLPTAAAPGADAELIRLAREHVELDRRATALLDQHDEAPPEVEEEVSRLWGECRALAMLIVELPACTIEGLRAKAAVMRAYFDEAFEPEMADEKVLLAHSIARDLLGDV